MKMLPYPDTPIFICYHNKAFPLGIIQANSPEDIKKWICSKSVNCVYNPNSPKNKFDFAINDVWGVNEGIVMQQLFYLKKEVIELSNIDLIEFFKIVIDNNCYIHGTYNEKYIPQKRAYNKEDYYHDFLIIGYDDKFFVSAGFIANGRFEKYYIPHQNFVDSLYNVSRPRIDLNFFSYNKDRVPSCNCKRMIDDMEKYIATANYFENPTPDKTSYGISSIMRLKDFFINEVEKKGDSCIDMRYSRVLYEHKWMLTQLVEVFLDDDINKAEYRALSARNFDRAKLVHMLGLKMLISKNAELICNISLLIDQIVEDEKKYIPQLTSLLKTRCEDGII